ncbi:hypothetical protein [uncultured Xylophilus sp.]|uniref:hypothetical protein n=1 Tax=uncultured Xylophilus sp. TaxID=296832 RepID=UPI0025CFD95F|nr:hypothetical protein [uncultured Xylophilus sp.]
MFAATRKIARKFGPQVAAVSTGALTLVGTARAALPEAVATEVSTYKTDALAALALVIGAGVAIWGLNKLASKLGRK